MAMPLAETADLPPDVLTRSGQTSPNTGWLTILIEVDRTAADLQ
jgi:hypothetical protein